MLFDVPTRDGGGGGGGGGGTPSLQGYLNRVKKSTRESKKWEEKCEKCPLPIRQNMLIVGL